MTAWDRWRGTSLVISQIATELWDNMPKLRRSQDGVRKICTVNTTQWLLVRSIDGAAESSAGLPTVPKIRGSWVCVCVCKLLIQSVNHQASSSILTLFLLTELAYQSLVSSQINLRYLLA